MSDKTAKTALDDLLVANERYAADFDRGGLTSSPVRRVAILTCMDARVVPHKLLGLAEGDAHVVRNAGGRASGDALRSLIVSSRLLGTRELAIIQHTDCGMMGLDEEAFRRLLHEASGVEAAIDFLSFEDLEQSVREDMAKVRDSPFMTPGVAVRGFVYDVATGRLREVT